MYPCLSFLNSVGTAWAPKKVAIIGMLKFSFNFFITRSIFNSASTVNPYPDLISIAPVPKCITSCKRFADCRYKSSKEVSCNFLAEFKIPPPFFAISS